MTMDEVENKRELPGAHLASIRIQKGYSTDYVAGKLHLRVHLIELLEADDYANMPEPVFIRGYFRAYAKLLDVAAEPLIETFNMFCLPEKKIEKALWQSRRETPKGEYAIRWLTAIFAVGVLVAVAIWWHNNKENETILKTSVSRMGGADQKSGNIRLTDLSKMRSLLSPTSEYTTLEKKGE